MSRRTIVRAAGKAAWAAPVIVVVAGAPAHAASGIDLDVVSLTATRPTLSTTVDTALTVQNLGDPASNIEVMVAVTPSGAVPATFNPLSLTGGGFAAGTPTVVGLGFQVVLTRAANLGTGQTAACSFNFAQLTGTGSVTAQVISPTGNNNSAADTY